MAKKSKIVRELHLRKMVEQYSSKRKEIKAMIKDPKLSLEEKQKAKDECKELGFTKGTEKFGDCVMKMLSM